MKNLIVLVLLVVGGYQIYDRFIAVHGAFDENGDPLTLVFTFDECGKPCDDAIHLLESRNIKYENINVSEGEEQLDRLDQHGGGHMMPILIIGEHRLDTFFHARIISVLAEVFGQKTLSRAEDKVMDEHFDNEGNPILVMYATKSCGFCKQADQYFKEAGIEYKNLDIEDSDKAKRGYELLQATGTPLVYVGFRRVEGFNKKAVDRALELL